MVNTFEGLLGVLAGNAVLFAHYREPVRPKEAAQFWEISPSAAKDNLVAFPLEAA